MKNRSYEVIVGTSQEIARADGREWVEDCDLALACCLVWEAAQKGIERACSDWRVERVVVTEGELVMPVSGRAARVIRGWASNCEDSAADGSLAISVILRECVKALISDGSREAQECVSMLRLKLGL